jgi:processing peptidase subunit beta
VQFGKQNLIDWGELPRGEIPGQLATSPVGQLTRLENGVGVATEVYGTDVSVVSVFIKAGSRYETIESSGSARMLTHLFLRGTKNKSRGQIESALNEMGTKVEVSYERELIGLTMRVCSEDSDRAVDLLCEMVAEVNLNETQLEAEKEAVENASRELCRDQYEQTLESCIYSAFRDHMMGQPSRGNGDNVANLTSGMVKEHVERTYAGRNFTVVASGNVNHEAVVKASRRLASLPKEATRESAIVSTETPLLTPSMMVARDDEMANVNVCVAYKAPPRGNPESYLMNFYASMLGSYNANEQGIAHLNSEDRQYHNLHAQFGERPGITLHQAKYIGFSDVGLFTTWTHGNEIWSKDMMFMNQVMLGKYATILNQVEVFRARAALFNSLLEERPGEELNLEIAKDVQYTGRRVDRTERAFRYSFMADQQFLQEKAKAWFYDKDTALGIWGPCNTYVKEFSYYNSNMYMATRGNGAVLF